MSGSFEKSVKGATKIKNAPPKTKYIEHILVATHSGDAGVGEVFRSLQHRLRDSTWTVVLKSLLTTHIMIREGSPDVTLSFLARHRNVLGVGHFADAQTQGRNIRHYANYLSERARAFRDTKIDWVRSNESRLEKLSVDKGLLREAEVVQNQLSALVKCDVLETEPENEITIAIFRLLVLDLLSLFQVLNQGLINVLDQFCVMSKTDAQRALEIYRTFTRQTEHVSQYLNFAHMHEHQTRVEVPKLKYAPITMIRKLERWLKDPDFEINRRQFQAEQDAKKKVTSSKPAKIDFPKPSSPNLNDPFLRGPDTKADSKPQANKGPEPDLIDFFDSIEQKQTTLPVNSQPASMVPGLASLQPQSTGMPFPQNGFVPQQTGFVPNNLFQQQQDVGGFMPPQQPQQPQQPQPLHPSFTGAGFGGFSTQPSFQPGVLGPIPQNSEATFINPNQGFQYQVQQQQQQQQQHEHQQPSLQTAQPNPLQPTPTGTTNPFRQSMMPPASVSGNSSPFSSPGQTSQQLQRHSTNPFARSPTQSTSPFQSVAAIQTQPTGTNPFAKTQQVPSLDQSLNPAPLGPQPTGTTNLFRQGAFVNHATGMGWQHNQTTIGGGLDQLPTVPVFPRPAQQTPWQQ
ncbi:ENTH domain containing protein [Metarhizium album ARSEF 1941]|uniref:ENTH domain containing protein n=1 Tax=Metarhizium album (strain ARSEF 1941) TaxID=1081103 RepID=A0A0B2WM26_METAS|nr:ENTH domain containing protein [Metarhizium album ARSEF 1941]KHN94709.1 ENTH domain containing protein [Metarhizium album ARSEF 1941]